MKGMKCKACGSGYHCCTNCDNTGVPWEIQGWCSGDCYWEWSQDEIERLMAELDSRDRREFRLVLWMLDESGVEGDGCITGDCPHLDASQCAEHLLARFESEENILETAENDVKRVFGEHPKRGE